MIIGEAGIYILNLEIGARIEGSYTKDGVQETGSYQNTETLLAPFPLFGVQFNYDINRRWALATAVEAVYLPFGTITGKSLRTRIHTRLALGPRIGIAFGLSYFDIVVRQELENETTDVEYGYKGVFAGLYFAL
jgi:hypothetical protein